MSRVTSGHLFLPFAGIIVGLGMMLASMVSIGSKFLAQKGVVLPVPQNPMYVSVILALVGMFITSKATARLHEIRHVLKLQEKLAQVGKKAMGNVTSLAPHFIYEFPLPNGRKIQGIFDAKSSELGGLYLGSAIEVVYNPANPEENLWTGG